jgi:thymidylate synthase (FAD)
LGIRKEDARFLLPNAAETRIVATMNFAAWSHFLWLRAVDKAAQWEIRAHGPAGAGDALRQSLRRCLR